jgi:high-affinity iron transporter
MLLHMLIGYDSRPAGLQVLFYFVTMGLISMGMKFTQRQHAKQKTSAVKPALAS